MYVFTLLHHEQKTFNSAIANKEENMRFDYYKVDDMWFFEDMVNDVKISVFATRWTETRKGPMLDFKVRFSYMLENTCFEIEILTDKFEKESVEDYCKLMRNYYISRDFLKNITEKGSNIFKCHANGYLRKIGRNNIVYGYVKSEWYKKLKITSVRDDWHGLKLKENEKPAQEYPESRIGIGCICD